MKSILCFTLLLGTSLVAHATPEECRVATVNEDAAEHIRWQGACKDGWAEGVGVLEKKGKDKDGWRYEGAVQRGRPHGHGYMKMGNGRQYEGEYVDGELNGMGIELSRIGDRYDGGFKQGKRHGRGSIAYALGGRYDGDWLDGDYHGRGLVEFPGGRKVQTTFVNGAPVEQSIPDEDQLPHRLLSERASTGSIVRHSIVRSTIVPNKSYEQMSAAERHDVRASYPLMDECDEPPFPLKGMEAILRGMSAMTRYDHIRGELFIIVMIDSEGKAVSANVYAAPDTHVGKFAAQLLMLEKYKPAKCAGKPCAMAFSYYMDFVL